MEATFSNDCLKLYQLVQREHIENLAKSEYCEITQSLNPQHPHLLSKLLPFQVDGIKWMLFQELFASTSFSISKELLIHMPAFCADTGHMCRGGILADEMGLGKTVSILSLILSHPKPNMQFNQIYQVNEADEMLPEVSSPPAAIVPTKYSESQLLCLCHREMALPSEAPLPKKKKRELLKIHCPKCGFWQHRHCVGMTETDAKETQDYLCPSCWGQHRVVSKATLVVCPDHILDQWRDEIELHVQHDVLNVMIYFGHKKKPTCTKEMFGSSDYVQPTKLAAMDVVLTTYSVLRHEIHRHNAHFGKQDNEDEEEEGDVQNKRRRKRSYLRPSCPLSSVHWWRICLDEAQMVASSNTKIAKMAQGLHSEYRWLVSGTPIPRSFQDLAGLLAFLNVNPFQQQSILKAFLVDPFLNQYSLNCGHQEETEPEVKEEEAPVECDSVSASGHALVRLISKLLWRNTKLLVADQLQLPPIEEHVSYLTFSPTERFFYQRCLQKQSEFLQKSHPEFHSWMVQPPQLDISAEVNEAGTDDDEPVTTPPDNSIAISQSILTHILSTLRIVCSDPSLIFSPHSRERAQWCDSSSHWNRRSMMSQLTPITGNQRYQMHKRKKGRKSAASKHKEELDQVLLEGVRFGGGQTIGATLETVLKEIELSIKEAMRLVLFHECALAGYKILLKDLSGAVEQYVDILHKAENVFQEYKFHVDNSQMLHVLVNLHDVLHNLLPLTGQPQPPLPSICQRDLMQWATDVRCNYLKDHAEDVLVSHRKIVHFQSLLKQNIEFANVGNAPPHLEALQPWTLSTLKEILSLLDEQGTGFANFHSDVLSTGAFNILPSSMSSKSMGNVAEVVTKLCWHAFAAHDYIMTELYPAIQSTVDALHLKVEWSESLMQAFQACSHNRPWRNARTFKTMYKEASSIFQMSTSTDLYCCICRLNAANIVLSMRLFVQHMGNFQQMKTYKHSSASLRDVLTGLLKLLQPDDQGEKKAEEPPSSSDLLKMDLSKKLKTILSILEILEKECQVLAKCDVPLEEWWKFHSDSEDFKLRMQCTHPDLPAFVAKSRIRHDLQCHEWELQVAKQKLHHLEHQYRFLLSSLSSERPKCPICLNTMEDTGVYSSFLLFQNCWHCICESCLTLLKSHPTPTMPTLSSSPRKPMLRCPICRQELKRLRNGDIQVVPYSFIDWQRQQQCNEMRKQHNITELTSDDEEFLMGDHSTKINAILKAIWDLKKLEGTCKVVIFSNWRSVLYTIYSSLHSSQKVSCCYLFHADQRESLDQFRHQHSRQVLLLPLDLANNGLNLTEANHIFFVDSNVNAAVDTQAISRIHRLGQTKPCTIHRFLIRNTVEENCYAMLKSQENGFASHAANVVETPSNLSGCRTTLSIISHVFKTVNL